MATASAKPQRPSVDALLSLVFFVGIAGHVAGLWQIPQLRESPPPSTSAAFDPRAITVAFARVHSGGVTVACGGH